MATSFESGDDDEASVWKLGQHNRRQLDLDLFF